MSAMDFPHPIHFNVIAFTFLERTWQRSKKSEARTAITKSQRQLAIEWIGVRRHEKSARAATISNREQRKRPLVFAAIPFHFTLPLRLTHNRPHRRNQISSHAFDPMNLFVLGRHIGFESARRII